LLIVVYAPAIAVAAGVSIATATAPGGIMALAMVGLAMSRA
jgi:hypothetical protein